MFVLSFTGFLRSSEVLGLKSEDLELSKGFVLLTIPESKTNKLRDGNSVLISEVKDSMICPVTLLKKYLHKANIQLCTNKFLFRPISVSRKSQRLVSVENPSAMLPTGTYSRKCSERLFLTFPNTAPTPYDLVEPPWLQTWAFQIGNSSTTEDGSPPRPKTSMSSISCLLDYLYQVPSAPAQTNPLVNYLPNITVGPTLII